MHSVRHRALRLARNATYDDSHDSFAHWQRDAEAQDYSLRRARPLRYVDPLPGWIDRGAHERDEQIWQLQKNERRYIWDEIATKLATQTRILRRSLETSLPFLSATLQHILFGSWVNILLPFVPAGLVVRYTHCNAVTIFAVNFIAIFPCSALLAFAVDELMFQVGDKVAALLSMSFGNIVQVLTSVLLLKSRQIRILKISLLGSILSNLLLMTGLSFFFGGLYYKQQYFNLRAAQMISMLLLLAIFSLVVPTASQMLAEVSDHGVVVQSRGTAILILVSYVLWLVFQLKTHRTFFDTTAEAGERIEYSKKRGEVVRSLANMGASSAAAVGGQVHTSNLVQAWGEEEDRDPKLSMITALAVMGITTALIAFNTQFATDSIQGLLLEAGLTENLVGMVLLPLLSVDTTSITMAVKDKMSLSITLTLERCMQTSLMVVPLIIILAWGMHIDEMTLQFEGFMVVTLFATITIVTYVILDGTSNWLTGALLLKIYLIISLAAHFID